jgi:hypothetical protein
MTEALLELDEHTHYVLNFIKNKYNMKDISEVTTLLALQYEDTEEEIPDNREYNPEFIKEMLALKNEPHFGPFKDFDEMMEYIRNLPEEDEKQEEELCTHC